MLPEHGDVGESDLRDNESASLVVNVSTLEKNSEASVAISAVWSSMSTVYLFNRNSMIRHIFYAFAFM